MIRRMVAGAILAIVGPLAAGEAICPPWAGLRRQWCEGAALLSVMAMVAWAVRQLAPQDESS